MGLPLHDLLRYTGYACRVLGEVLVAIAEIFKR
jgi:hypothetical protein